MITIRQLQEEQDEWAARNFKRTDFGSLLGIGEEYGELCHSHLKGMQEIRYTPEQVLAKKKDALADILIFMVDYATMNDIDLELAVEETWQQVKQRDWVANPMNAAQIAEGV